MTEILLLHPGFTWENFSQHGAFPPEEWPDVLSAIFPGGVILTFIGFRTMFDMAGKAKIRAWFLVFEIRVGTVRTVAVSKKSVFCEQPPQGQVGASTGNMA